MDYGAKDILSEWHRNNPDRPDPHGLAYAIMHIQQLDEDERAMDTLIKRHKLQGASPRTTRPLLDKF